MKADAAQTRDVEHLRRNDKADEGQNREIGVESDKFLTDLRGFERFMLAHGNAQLHRFLLNRIEFAARRVGRAVDRDDLFTLCNKLVQSFFSESRLADQDDAQSCARFPIGAIQPIIL